MNKRTIFQAVAALLLIFLSGAVVTACSNDDDADDSVQQTVIMFCPFAEGLYNPINTNIADIKNAIADNHGTGNTRFVVYHVNNSKQASIYELTYEGGKTVEKYWKKDIDVSKSSPDTYTTTEGLTSLLSSITAHYPAENYSLIIGCHGSNWLPTGIRLDHIDNPFGASKPLRSFGAANDSNYKITVPQLVEALSAANIHCRFILFDVCYMAGIEIAYDLRHSADYLIVSPTEVMAAGLPYRNLTMPLLRHDYKAVVNAFASYYDGVSRNVNGQLDRRLGTLSVINCTAIESLAQDMRTINAAAVSTTPDISKVQVLDGLSPSVFFDMLSWARQIATPEQLTLLETHLKEAVPFEYHTHSLFSKINVERIRPISECCGLTISDPTQNTDVIPTLTKPTGIRPRMGSNEYQ